MMTRSDRKRSLNKVLETEGERLQRLIEDYFPAGGEPGDRAARMKYVMDSGGKRLRPILSVVTFRAVGGEGDSIYHFALLWEIIHNFSLVHDDLPIMDDDDYRRGKPTLHKVYEMKEAVLTGLDLLNVYFEIASELVGRFGVPGSIARDIIAIITEAAGFPGMVGGQMMDLYWEGGEFGPETVGTIHRRKTARMIEGPIAMGAVLGGADDAELQALRTYGLHLGLAYQIADDLLDSRSNFLEMGKATRRDSELKKATYLSISGVKDAEKRLEIEIDRARDAWNRTGIEEALLMELLDFTLRRGIGVEKDVGKPLLDEVISDGRYH